VISGFLDTYREQNALPGKIIECIPAAAIVPSANTFLAGACILFFVLGFYQILSGKYCKKVKSILPAELEQKRIEIAVRHNQLVGVLLLAFFGALFSCVTLLRHGPRFLMVLAMVLLLCAEFYAIRRLFKYDEQMCEQWGFMCPHCHKPLYEPRSFINLNGRCPKCQKSILTDAIRSSV
jgi:hypothetical protein